MPPCRPAVRHGVVFWLVLTGATLLMSLEPGLFLVVLALALSGVTLVWLVMLARLLLFDALAIPPVAPPALSESTGDDDAPQRSS